MSEPMQEKLEGLLSPLVAGLGFELWGLEYAQRGDQALLRVFIDRDAGVTLDDCALISEQVGALLDVEDPITLAYRLEVSSPGLDRVLFRPEQYCRYLGERLKLRLSWAVDGRRNVQGRLVDCDELTVKVEVEMGEVVAIPLEAVHRARLIYEMASGQPEQRHAVDSGE
ncbi:ribosome maturation factor RimP [Acidihalobacter yilgarnensis]|uniref:Ribosome maturation factor RimP n=1 Tax=Acidihalobacter yilgarnensis TaxID=2819280 RepID=A0A1D8ISY8_9GAMM|nr:ribosome maturation factor RimP [Acidihalobacter yilgarnensis]AOU99586.1 ribosome maturation factor RimP [Acidihalobacter yilgarnensis]